MPYLSVDPTLEKPPRWWVNMWEGHKVLGSFHRELFDTKSQAMRRAKQLKAEWAIGRLSPNPARSKDEAILLRLFNEGFSPEWEGTSIRARDAERKSLARDHLWDIRIVKLSTHFEIWIKRKKEKNPHNPPRDYGRIDWMPRKKVYRVIRYKGTSDVPSGDFKTLAEAQERLRLIARMYSRKHNPFGEALVYGAGLGAGWAVGHRIVETGMK